MRLELSSVSKRFGVHVALTGVDLHAVDLHSLVLIGPSGGGKSTLLRILAGLEAPDAGTIAINSQPLPREEEALRTYRRGIGVVFQSFNLFPHLTALRNITLPLEVVHGRPAADAREIALQHLARFRLAEHAGKKPGELSGGQRQRVAIARALSIEPKLLLFDEPTSALDPEMTGEVLDVIEELRSEQRDIIVVTHHMAFARRLGDLVAVLAEGRIVEAAPPAQIFDHPAEERTAQFLSRVLRH